jgi:heat shock protein HtpX
MELWSQPMTARTMAILLAGILVWLILIAQEIRKHARARMVALAPRVEAEPAGDRQAGLPSLGELPSLGTIARAAFLLLLLAFPFLVVGVTVSAAVAALVMGLLFAVILWSLWQAGPVTLARCGARPVADAGLTEIVAELAGKAGIPPPHLLETQENHANAFTLAGSPARAAIIVTRGLRMRLSGAELRAVVGREVARIARHDTARATVGVTLLSPVAALAARLGLIGPSVHGQGAGALLFLLLLTPLSALVLRFSAAPERAFGADREGALLCGAPEDLIAALSKLEASAPRFESITAKEQPALAALCIVDPLPHSWVGHLFAAQPRTDRRIARLRALRPAAAAVAVPAS